MIETLSLNRSKTYLYPLLLEFFNLPDNIAHNFINCFVLDVKMLHTGCIYLLYNYDVKNREFIKFEYELSRTDGYIKHYDLKNNNILFVLKFPEEYMYEYNCYIDSEYSKYKTDAKNIILRYYKNKVSSVIYNRLNGILNKSPELKIELEKRLGVSLSNESELGEIVDVIAETIDIEDNLRVI